MRLPRTFEKLVGHHRHPPDAAGAPSDLPAALNGRRLRRGLIRLLLFAGLVVALIVAVPGLGSIRGRLAHGNPAWLVIAASFRLLSALSYVVLFRAIFAPKMALRLSYQIAMSEIGLNALVPAGGASGLAIGGWVLHRRGMPTEEVVQRSAQFFVFTSAFNVGAVAVLGWLGAAGILVTHGSLALSAIPALGASAVMVLAVALVPQVTKLQARQARTRAHSLHWWLDDVAIQLGTGAQGAIDLFRKHDPRALAGGAAYLMFDIGALWAAVHAFGGHMALQPLAMAYLVGQLAGEIPVPGGLGAVDGGLIATLTLYGLPVSIATAGALAYRAIALGVPVVFGGLAAIGLTRTIRGWARDDQLEVRTVAAGH
ncbi:MAG TPA: lysylphosphatidylglycerol synthase transmembrane domain-containing protein [Solirubrobacteraceae bacterium]|nr:lysylphosphatidylglycerol synthase transmembrane domain-containing protein [Solirubrobacteraceae bacterium]